MTIHIREPEPEVQLEHIEAPARRVWEAGLGGWYARPGARPLTADRCRLPDDRWLPLADLCPLTPYLRGGGRRAFAAFRGSFASCKWGNGASKGAGGSGIPSVAASKGARRGCTRSRALSAGAFPRGIPSLAAAKVLIARANAPAELSADTNAARHLYLPVTPFELPNFVDLARTFAPEA